MAWSTRELADLAGTTVKAVRHYHRVGLLDEPARRSNGYKQYEVRHLVRLLHIRRLVDLGLPLAQIAAMQGPDDDPSEALGVIDAELAATIERLQRIRGELAAIRQHGAPVDLPADFGGVGADLAPSDRSLVMIYSRVFDDSAMHDMREMLAAPRTEADIELEELPADAGTATKVRLAERLAPEFHELAATYPWITDPGSHADDPARAESTVALALGELYNPAQREVLYRAHLLATGRTDDRLPPPEENT